MTRQSVIDRARTWNPGTPQRVPYSQSRHRDGYRTDCSGYASIALGLGAPGPNTGTLASPRVSSPIAMSDLLTGDNNTRHAVIFEKWSNAERTSYWAYEQRGPGHPELLSAPQVTAPEDGYLSAQRSEMGCRPDCRSGWSHDTTWRHLHRAMPCGHINWAANMSHT
ncbi:hypothetical protein ACIBF6_12960 [Streptosporangium amethystogenes]|uniref:hypothetical protein n=1 Tax=Streptosporangium amethystogenes TaxID=2002 RepID=UPI00378B8F37